MPLLPKRRWFWLGTCLVFTACAGGTFLAIEAALQPPAKGPFWVKYQQVQLGMTKVEVENILGPPADEELPGMSCGPDECTWNQRGQTIWVSIGWGGPAPWGVEKKYFVDEHGRVCDVTVASPDAPTWLERLRARLRW